ncbi:alpha/beta fold hydrolase [Dactylosporangium sp. CS-047395]|uniref:alpha/beta fold hydrolase n=1 Tax=Dactylosporangium sp. CS-047395 TaxID=3239936 RepID=UPI003D92FF3C
MKRRTLAAVAALVTAGGILGGTAQPALAHQSKPKPTIVFVHGAFADASGFAASIAALTQLGYPVVAPANPLRGLASDAAYLRSVLAQIPGPVVLVGHSYGGAVITNAATGNPNVKALVYIAAYALAEGEAVAQANELGGGHSTLLDNVELRDYPGAPPLPPEVGGGADKEATIKQATFRQIFAADVPAGQAAVMAATQRPAALISLITPSGPPAWKTVPSWYLVARDDKAIPPAAERAMAKRAGAHTVEVASSHAAMVSRPGAVTALILAAVR